jgi:hypothetical protein
MKKILTAFIAAILIGVCAFSFAVSGAEKPFKIEISGSTAVTAGSTATFTVTVKDIDIKSSVDGFDDGLGAVGMVVRFDTDFFDASSLSVTCPTLENWAIDKIDADKANGKIVITAMGDPVQGIIPTVKDNGVLSFVISLKVKENATEGSGKEIYIDSSDLDTYACDGASMEVTGFECGSLDVSLVKKLAKPEGLVIDKDDNFKAKWNAVENADAYEIQVYKDGEKLGKPLTATGTSYDLSTLITNNFGGEYTFTVVAKSNSELYKDSDTATSSVCNYRGKLKAPSISLTVDKIAGTVGYKITDDNPEDTVGTYIIKIYDKDGKPVGDDIPSSKLTGTIKDLELGVKYSVTVTASSSSLSNTESGNLSSDESKKASVTPDGIVGIKVTKKPTLSYTEGDTIDLSKMEITVDFAVAADAKIGKDKFEEYGITVSPKHGADAILSLNEKPLTVTCGTLTAAEEMILVVKSGTCEHATTEPEHKDATCGEDGYDKVVCTVCGVAIENTPIPATGNHEFSEWAWLSKPTVNVDGVRQRACSVCGKTENEQITYAEYLEMQAGGTTTPPDTTPSTTNPTTTPPETSERRKSTALGGVDDLGKIFLFALIMVLAVIVVFIVGAIYVESRRNRRRRSRSRTNQARNAQNRSGQSGNGQNRNNYRR